MRLHQYMKGVRIVCSERDVAMLTGGMEALKEKARAGESDWPMTDIEHGLEALRATPEGWTD